MTNPCPGNLPLELVGHTTQTVQKRGWSGLKNGELLRRASAEFDVFVTGDQNLEFQQNTTGLSIAVVVLIAVNSRIETLRSLIPELLKAIESIDPGQLIRVRA